MFTSNSESHIFCSCGQITKPSICNFLFQEYCATSWPTLESWYNKHLYPKADQHRFK